MGSKQQVERSTTVLKGMLEIQAEKRRLATAKEVNKIKMVKFVVIGASTLIILVAIIIAVVKLKKNNAVVK